MLIKTESFTDLLLGVVALGGLFRHSECSCSRVLPSLRSARAQSLNSAPGRSGDYQIMEGAL